MYIFQSIKEIASKDFFSLDGSGPEAALGTLIAPLVIFISVKAFMFEKYF